LRRRTLGWALIGVGAILLLLCGGIVGYAQWAEWQHNLQEPAALQETLPERLEVEPSDLVGFGGEAAENVASAAATPPAAPAHFEPVVVGATAGEPVPPAPPVATAEPIATGSLTSSPSAADVWLATLGPVEAAWGSDWPEAIALLEAYQAQFPDDATVAEKLYAARVTYGQALIESGAVEEGVAQLERAQELLPGRGEGAAALLALTPTPRPAATPTPRAVAPAPAAAPAPASAPAAPLPASRSYGRPVSISIPRIGVNSRVVAVAAPNGEYQVPAWDVGYQADSADPGAGNSVFVGHLTTINAGRVFARLSELRPGDAIYLYTSGYRLDWVVQGVRIVLSTDSSFILPTGDIRITLYTCAGQYTPLKRDYSHRLVVVGGLARTTPR
jgi:LPXTG-site transpeptidase (sortase) family protein